MNNIAKAIKNINNDAEFSIENNDINQITWLNETNEISKADIQAQITIIEQEKQDAINKKASAKQKLLDLGLTEEEIKLTFGV